MWKVAERVAGAQSLKRSVSVKEIETFKPGVKGGSVSSGPPGTHSPPRSPGN